MNARPSLRPSLCALSALMALSLGFDASAQSVTTTPVGAMTYTFPATTKDTTTYISIPLTNPAVYTGPVASLTANTITFSGTPFTAGELAVAGSPFFVRIAAGPQAGRTMLVTANTANTITVDTTDNSSQTTALDTSGWALAAGNKVEVIVGDTLASLFGDGSPGNALLLTGHPSSLLSADTVGIYNKQTGKVVLYYYNTTSSYWRTATQAVSANAIVIYPDSGVSITRLTGRPEVTLTIVGDVPKIAARVKTIGGSKSVQTGTLTPVDITLSQWTPANWVKNDSGLSADTVSIFNATSGKFDIYYQRSNSQWNRLGGGVTDRSTTVIPAGTAIRFTKIDSNTGDLSFVAVPLSYTLQ